MYCIVLYRFLFGSVIDTIGRTEKDLYIIQEILLQEQKPSGIVAHRWLNDFVVIDLRTLADIPAIEYLPLTKKKLRTYKSSLRCKQFETIFADDRNADDDNDTDSSDIQGCPEDSDDEPRFKVIA